MAVAEPQADTAANVPGITRPMTYEEYLASPEEMARYDIVDGWKVYRLYGEQQVANPTVLHQDVQGNLYTAFRAFARSAQAVRVVMAPCDVLVSLSPRLRTRQPDLLLISHARFGPRALDDPAPLSPAPELVVEIVSPSDKPAVLDAKITDYCAADARELWAVRPETQTMEVLRLTPQGAETIAAYGQRETAQSVAFPGLAVAVANVFAV